MDKAQLIALIAILYALEIEARAETVKHAAKENNLKEGELFKLLKEAGYEPKAPKGTAAPNGADIQQQPDNNTPPNNGQGNGGQNGSDQNGSDQLGSVQEAEKTNALVSHKTEYDKYRCAGLVLTRKPENYLVTEAQLGKLKNDPWVAVGE
ncbi:MAG: hypothetical protein LBQ69_04940 [Treponema sp.]|jgi:hypothetical protein|nr:hypothetical protein [Treponema sp.]